jgi:hypothetical protein
LLQMLQAAFQLRFGKQWKNVRANLSISTFCKSSVFQDYRRGFIAIFSSLSGRFANPERYLAGGRRLSQYNSLRT